MPNKRAQHQEGGVVGRQPGQHLDHRVEDQIDHQRQAPAVTIRQQSENESSHGTKSERRGDGQRDGRSDLWNSFPIAVRQSVTRKKSNASSVQPRKPAVSAAP